VVARVGIVVEDQCGVAFVDELIGNRSGDFRPRGSGVVEDRQQARGPHQAVPISGLRGPDGRGPEPIDQLLPTRKEQRANDGQFFGLGLENRSLLEDGAGPGGVGRQQGQGGTLLHLGLPRVTGQLGERPIDPGPVAVERRDDRGDLADVGHEQLRDQTSRLDGLLLPVDAPPQRQYPDRRSAEHDGSSQGGGQLSPGRRQHHPALGRSPVPGSGPEQDHQPLPDRGELARLGPGIPEVRTFLEPELGPSTGGLLLLAGEPLADRRHEFVVRELVVAVPRGWRHR